MKKTIVLLLAVLLCLSLCACGKRNAEEAMLPGVEDGYTAVELPLETKDNRHYQRVEITAENWSQYFELCEIPLYSITSSEVIAQVYQNYCVVLRDEYTPYIRPEGEYSVRFEVSFDLYINTLDVDTNAYIYSHTDDLFYAVQATKSAEFNSRALQKSAYGTDHSLYSGYGNAFFSGWATIHPDSKVWSGFYIDLSQARVVSAAGYIELA